jgi:hypothetical protein
MILNTIVFHDLNPVAMLDLELSLRDLLGETAQLQPLANITDIAEIASNPEVALFLLDAKLGAAAYAPLNGDDPRVFFLADRPQFGQMEKRPSSYTLRKIPAIARLLAQR